MISPLLQSANGPSISARRTVKVAHPDFQVEAIGGGAYVVYHNCVQIEYASGELWMLTGPYEIVAHCADTEALPFDLASGFQRDRVAHAIVSNWPELVEVMYNNYQLD